MEDYKEYKLTEYTTGGGCGCKIAPSVLHQMLQTNIVAPEYENLLVGNNSMDDAAAYDLGNGTAMIATTDFFTPIVNDAYDFGRIAAANAISDVYAMGGTPVMAIAILSWPLKTLPIAVGQKVLEGARTICKEAGIPLAGGHSIDTSEPIFGLAVNGTCDIKNLKRNNTAKAGNLIFLTKPIGVGIMSAALKKGVLKEEHYELFKTQLVKLNSIGEQLGKINGVTAMTDVTGFGLGGHLIEMAEGSGLSAELIFSNIKIIEGIEEYRAQKIAPGATNRNWNGYGHKINIADTVDTNIINSLLPDPQTNGGLLIAVDEAQKDIVIELFIKNGLENHIMPIGRMMDKLENVIYVK